MRRLIRTLALTALAFVTLLAATCPPQPAVTIHYKQFGACNGYVRVRGGVSETVSAGPGAAFVGFQLIAIDNTTGTNFLFDPERLYVPGSPRQHVSRSLAPMVDFGPTAAIAQTIPAGTREDNKGMAIAVVSTSSSSDPQLEANRTRYDLQYETAVGSPGVVLVNDDLDRTSWPATADCTMLFRTFAPLFPNP